MPQEFETLEDLHAFSTQSQDPESLKANFLESPEEEWTPPAASEMLRFRLHHQLNQEQEELIRGVFSEIPLFDLENGFDTQLTFTLAETASRVEMNTSGLLGNESTYIQDPEQGVLYLNTEEDWFIHLEKSKIPQFQHKKGVGSPFEHNTEWRNNQEINRLEIQLQEPIQGIYTLWLDPNSEYLDYAQSVIKASLGCSFETTGSSLDSEMLASFGMPIEMSLQVRGTDTELTPLASIQIEILSREAYNPDLFMPPAGFTDYRSLTQVTGEQVLVEELDTRDLRSGQTDGQQIGQSQSALTATSYGVNQQALKTSKSGNLKMPECFSSTYGAKLANLLDQNLLDDMKHLMNGVTRRLGLFEGRNGNLKMDWMNQFESHANSLNGGNGSGLFHLLRDDKKQGLGLLDRLAESQVRSRLIGNNLKGIVLDPALEKRIRAVLADGSIKAINRFDRLSKNDQRDLREAWFSQFLGQINIPYPSQTPVLKLLNDLLRVQASGIKFAFDFSQQSIFKDFKFTGQDLQLRAEFPMAKGKAILNRWPGPSFILVPVVAGLGCILFPPSCFFLGPLTAIATFLAFDLSELSLEISQLSMDARISWKPNSEKVLKPEVKVQLNGKTKVFYISVVPTALHQIFNLIISAVGSFTSLILDALEAGIQSTLNNLIQRETSLSYPPPLGQGQWSAFSNIASFAAQNNMYIETEMDAGLMGSSGPFATQVGKEVKSHLFQARTDFTQTFPDPLTHWALENYPGLQNDITRMLKWVFDKKASGTARYYLGTVLSQNFINQYINVLWREQKFNFNFSRGQGAKLISQMNLPSLGQHAPQDLRLHLWPATSPRLVFTPKVAEQGGSYATAWFDDLRLCIELWQGDDPKSLVEISFSAKAACEIAFGGSDSDRHSLDLIKTKGRLFDLYFDLKSIEVAQVQGETRSKTTAQVAFRQAGDHQVLDEKRVTDSLVQALKASLVNRSVARIPKSKTAKNVHIYPIGTPAISLTTQIIPFEKNLYLSMGLSGPLLLAMQGLLDIDQLDKKMAEIIRAFIPNP